MSSINRVPIPAFSAAAAEIPKGEVTKYTFDQSKIFPGTVRDYWVYVPRQYDPAKPACLHVNQDGIQFNAAGRFRRADRQEGDAGDHRRVRDARPRQGDLRRMRSIASTAATNTTAWATITPGSCSTSCCPRWRRKRPPMDGRSGSRTTATIAHRRLQQRRDLRLHGRLGTARCLPPRLQRDRHLRRPARRERSTPP